MASISALVTAHPKNQISLEESLSGVEQWLADDEVLLSKAREIFQNAAVKTRYSPLSVQDLISLPSFEESNRIYRRHSEILSLEVTRRALDEAGLLATDLDLIIVTTCTGYALPGLDAYLINNLQMYSTVKRLPFVQLGCSGGVRCLGIAQEYLNANPHHNVMLLAAEFPTLTFRRHDRSLTNVVSAAIFGDGVSCAILSGQEGDRAIFNVTDAASHIFPDTEGLMGYNLTNTGFQIVLDRAIPQVIARDAGDLIWSFIKRGGTQVDFAAIHPGGRAVLELLEERCDIPREFTEASWKVLEEHGNMSSVTIFYILDELRTRSVRGQGIAVAFGPGFCLELVGLEAL